MKKKNHIVIQSWTGRILFQGHYKDKEVDKVLDANRCECFEKGDFCADCDHTGYKGDFEVYWVDDDHDNGNVYECINY